MSKHTATGLVEIRVRFQETDQMGVVHHSNYAVWLEAARVEWMRERGLSYRDLEDSGVSLAVSRLSVTYRRPARFDDLLTVETRLKELRSRRCTFDYRVSVKDGPHLADATSVHVPTDRTGRAVRLPQVWLDALC